MKKILFAATILLMTTAQLLAQSPCSVAGTASASEDSICDGGTTVLMLTGYVGAIQWQSYNGTAWMNETGPGSTTDTYSVSPMATTDFRAVVTDVGCAPDTSNTVTITVGVMPPTGTGATRCGYGPVTLTAAGGPVIKWYDAMTGGTPLFTGPSFTTNVASTTTFYAASATAGGGASMAPMPPQTSQYNAAQTRGYWFTAPVDFTITGLDVPVVGLTSPQSIAVLLMSAPPAVYSNYTCTFTILYLTQNNPNPGTISVNIPIYAGDIIGVLGCRSDTPTGTCYNSYATGGFMSDINGYPITLTRFLMQSGMNANAPNGSGSGPTTTCVAQVLGTSSIARVNMYYEVGCESVRTPVVATVTPSDSITVTGNPPALCIGGSSTLTVSSANTNYNYTWSPATYLSGTTGTTVTSTPLAPITYTVVADDGTCGAITTFLMDVGPLSNAGTATVSSDTICAGTDATLSVVGTVGNIQWQSNTGSGWVNETGTGNDSSQYLVTPLVNTSYWAVVTSGGCPPDTTGQLDITVITVTAPTGVDDTICGPGTVNLTATGGGGGLLNWYTAQTGGNPVDTGLVYSPSISNTTTFYVEATAGGGAVSVGPPTNGFGNQTNSATANYGLQFDVIQPITLVRVYIYSQAAGNLTVNLRATQGGPVLNTVTVPINAFVAHYPVNLNWAIPPGTGYRLELGAGSPSLYYNTSGAVYPYTFAGAPASITGYLNPNPNTGTNYYYFYDWVVSTGCSSMRVPVTGVVLTPPPVPTITQVGNQLTSSSPTNNQWYVNGTAIAGATGQVYVAPGNGSYTVVVTDPNGCTSESLPVLITTVDEQGLAQAGVSVFPNPAGEFLWVRSGRDARITLMNALGETVVGERRIVAGATECISLHEVPSGWYVVQTRVGDRVYHTPLVRH